MRLKLIIRSVVVGLLLLNLSCLSYQMRIPARGFIYRGEKPQPGLGAYGYVVFPSAPDATHRPRFERVCESFLRTLPDQHEYEGRDKASLMVTHWMLTRHVDSQVCSALVDSYDYAEGNVVASAIGAQSRPGPFLVAWRQPFGEQSGAEGLLFDLSDFSDDDLDRAFGIWKEQISKDPSMWQNGFQLVKIREICRNLLIRYGDQVLAIIKPK